MTTPPAPPAPTPPPPPAPPAPTPPPPPSPTPPGPDPGRDPGSGGQSPEALAAALANERKERERVQRELDQLRRSGQTDQQRAVEDARKEGEAAARKAMGLEMAKARFAALAAGKVADPAAMVTMINLGPVVGEDGAVNEAELTKIVEALAKTSPATQPGQVRVPAGPQSGGAPVNPGDADFLGQGLRGGS